MDKTINTFVETAKHKSKDRQYDIKTAVKRVLTYCDVVELTLENLSKVDKIMAEHYSQRKAFDDNCKYRTTATHMTTFMKIAHKLYEYEFPLSGKYCHLRKDDILNELSRMLPTMSTSILVYQQYLKEKTSLTEATIHGYKVYAKLIIEHFKDKLIDCNLNRKNIISYLQNIEDSSDIDLKTKIQYKTSSCLNPIVIRRMNVINTMIKSEAFESIKSIPLVQRGEIKPIHKNVELIDRDYFTDEELDRIADTYRNDLERLIITILLSTGIRLGGLQNLKVKSVYDENMSVRNEGVTLEKGGKTRKFMIFPAMKQALENYRDGDYGSVLTDQNFALIPTTIKPKGVGNTKAYHRSTLARFVKEICVRAKVNGDHVHTHAFRKTVVVKLMRDGNTIDNVSKFIGHSNSGVTAQSYWTPTQADLTNTMNMSWLVGNKALTESSSSTIQLQKIANHILEGMRAKKRLEHALSLMSKEQIKEMELMWNTECDQETSLAAREVISDIAKISTTITSSMSSDD